MLTMNHVTKARDVTYERIRKLVVKNKNRANRVLASRPLINRLTWKMVEFLDEDSMALDL